VRQSSHKTVCSQALGINRKNIYRQCHQPAKDLLLKQQVEAIHRDHPAYGHRRIAYHLGINRKRAQRVMAHFQLHPPRRTIRTYTTHSTTSHTYPNRLKSLGPITRPHQVWCSDLSRLVYRGTLWYLATIEDVATRRIMAYQIGKRHDSALVLSTLQQALATASKPAIFHSDQGNEFMAQRCTDYLQQRDILISVSDVASPWQNGYQESFYGRFKAEFGDMNRFDLVGAFLEAIHHHIHYYNHHRIHTALKMPPVMFASQLDSDFCLQKLGT
jgi:transposase InsO family protein